VGVRHEGCLWIFCVGSVHYDIVQLLLQVCIPARPEVADKSSTSTAVMVVSRSAAQRQQYRQWQQQKQMTSNSNSNSNSNRNTTVTAIVTAIMTGIFVAAIVTAIAAAISPASVTAIVTAIVTASVTAIVTAIAPATTSSRCVFVACIRCVHPQAVLCLAQSCLQGGDPLLGRRLNLVVFALQHLEALPGLIGL